MSSYNTISSDKLARLIGTAKAPTLIDVRIDDDFAADPRLIPGAVRRSYRDVQEWAPRACRAVAGRRHLPEGEETQRRHRGLAAPGRHCRRIARRRSCRLGRNAEADRSRRQDTQARRPWPHRLGDARAAEDRPHRLPLADPPLHRSRGRLSLRRASGSGSGSRPLRRHPVRHRKRILEPPRRTLHLRRDGPGIRPLGPAAGTAGDDGSRGRYRAARPFARGARAACRLARPLAHVRRRPGAIERRNAAV